MLKSLEIITRLGIKDHLPGLHAKGLVPRVNLGKWVEQRRRVSRLGCCRPVVFSSLAPTASIFPFLSLPAPLLTDDKHRSGRLPPWPWPWPSLFPPLLALSLRQTGARALSLGFDLRRQLQLHYNKNYLGRQLDNHRGDKK